jgi:nucleoid DNA-binding protein
MPSSAPTKSQTYSDIADKTKLSKSEVAKVVEALEDCMVSSLKSHGQFKIMGLNVKVKKTPAKPARKGMNNLTGEMVTFKAKPASKTVRASAMKKLKEQVR